MNWKNLVLLINSDLYRFYGNKKLKTLLKALIINGGFQMSFFYRISNCLFYKKSKLLLTLAKTFLRFTCTIYNSEIQAATKIGSGLYLSHCSGIIINSDAVIGNNVNISHQVTIGIAGRGNKRGVPEIGNFVYIGPGAKIFGKIKIGNNVAIGANAVVSKDIPDNCVVVGIPAKIISENGSMDFILNVDY